MAIQTFPLNINNVDKFLEAQPSDNTIQWYRFNSGTSIIRILPPWNARGDLALRVYTHRIKYRASMYNFDKWEWTCKSNTYNHLGGQQYSCPICDAIATANAKGVDYSEYAADDSVYYCNAIVVKDPLYDREPKSKKAVAPGTHVILRLPWTVYSFVMSMIKEIGDITDLQTGRDIMVIKTGSGLQTKYQVTLGVNPPGPLPQEWLSRIPELYDLDKIFAEDVAEEAYQELANQIINSSGGIGTMVEGTQSNMAVPQYQVPQAQPQQYVAPQQQVVQPTQYAAPQPQPQPVQQQYVAPVPQQPVTTMPPAFGQTTYQANTNTPPMQAPVVNQPVAGGTKPCFGNFNPSDPNCIVCNEEPACAAHTN